MLIDLPPRGFIPAAKIYAKYIPKKNKSNEWCATDGDVTILLAPGGPGADHAIYKDQVEVLSGLTNVILFDPRGCGQSSISDASEYHMDVYIDDIEAIRQFFKLESFILLGTSYGSMVAMGYAIRYGNLALIGLLLVAGACSYGFLGIAKDNLSQIGSQVQIKMFSKLLNGGITHDDELREYFKVMAPLYSTKARNTNDKEEFHAAKQNVRYNATAALAGFGPNGFLRTFDWRDGLSHIKCPIKIVVGKEDWINDPHQLLEAEKLMENCEVHIVPNSGHFVWVDQKQLYFAVIINFISTVANAVTASNSR